MAILSIVTSFAGQVGVSPNTVKILCTDSLDAITAPGFLTGAMSMGYTFNPGDLLEIEYANNQTGIFTLSGSSADPIIVPGESGVITPTITNNVAIFANTEGTIQSSTNVSIVGGNLNVSNGAISGQYLSATGLIGAASVSRYIGATASGAPVSGTFVIGDVNVDHTGNMWVCTTAGTPGVWTNVGAAGSDVTSVFGRAGAVVAVAGDYTQNQITGLHTTDSPTFNAVTASTGNISASAGLLVSGSNAGGFEGNLELWPVTAGRGSLQIAAINNSGAFNLVIQNAVQNQSTTVNIPDSGVASTNFVLTNNASTQTIATGNLAVSAGGITGQYLSASGLTGATAVSRYAGATNSGAPVAGPFAIGDYVVARDGAMWVCTIAGSPGTWVEVGVGTSAVTSVFGRSGAVVAVAGDYTQNQITGLHTSDSPTFNSLNISNGISIVTGNVQTGFGTFIAGQNGSAGSFECFAPTLNMGFLELRCADNAGNFELVIINASLGQTSTATIPDPGVASTNFVLTNSPSTQTIASGNLTVSTGNIQAGSNGHVGSFTSFSATPNRGSLQIVATANSGNFVTTFSNNVMGQATVISIPDPGVASASLILSHATGDQTILGGGLLVEGGDVQAGVSGTAGFFQSFPSTANTGSMIIGCNPNSGNFTIVLSNASFGQTSTITIVDPVQSTGYLQVAKIASDPCANLITLDVNVTALGLVSANQVILYAGSGAKRYKIRALYENFGTSFSGGDRNISITDGTTTYSVLPAASLLTTGNSAWGNASLPFSASTAMNTSTVAGANLYAVYSGGTTDYVAGATVITAILERVA